MRRILLTSGALFAAFLVAGAPARASDHLTVNVESPLAGADLNGPVEVRVRVTGRSTLAGDPPASELVVEVRLSGDGHSPFDGSRAVRLTCVDGCGPASSDSLYAGVVLDPVAPGGFFETSAPMCNGRWYIQPRAGSGSFASGVSVQVARPPSAVAALDFAASPTRVDLSWQLPPEPDVSGFRVERRATGTSSWTSVTELEADATGYADRGVEAGTYDYRVVTMRPDGRDASGQGIAPCTGGATTLVRASDQRVVEVPEVRSSGSGETGSTDPPGEEGSGDGGGTGDGAGGGEDGSDGTAGEDGEVSASGGSTPSGSRGVAPPPPVGSGALGSPSLPDPDASVAAPRERFFGEDDPFAEELSYEGVDPVTGEPRTRAEATETLVPGTVHAFVSRYVDPQRVLPPVAAGLIFLALGLHLFRWLQEDHG